MRFDHLMHRFKYSVASESYLTVRLIWVFVELATYHVEEIFEFPVFEC